MVDIPKTPITPNYYMLSNAKSSSYIYTKYIWFCLLGISTIVGYLTQNIFKTHTHTHNYIYIYIYIYIYAKSSSYIYTTYIWFCLLGLSTMVGYLTQNPF